ncbi:hypothetical protein DFP97_105302 [Paenibacillus prosopidis]|uniref:Uncharacterized protein n=1 Tax=Paenibacillus prosopidis TaxID=630520 RepID=A0A368W259_9BACL|nr:hypothetical protein DFP97_105302 [Paenibacillus prosopidis]
MHRQYNRIYDRRSLDLRIFMIFIMLFFLSVLFVITMDLMFLQIPLQESLDNILIPFKSMMNEEILFISLIILYMVTKPIVIYFKMKK